MKQPRHYHAIRVRYYGPTDTKGSRVALKSLRFGCTAVIPYDYAENLLETASAWLVKQGYRLIGSAETPDGYIILTDRFEPWS